MKYYRFHILKKAEVRMGTLGRYMKGMKKVHLRLLEIKEYNSEVKNKTGKINSRFIAD